MDASLHKKKSVLQPCSVDLILFDFGGVLAEEGFREGLIAIAQHNNLNTDTFIKRAYAVTFAGGFVTGQIDEKAFWQTLRKQTGIQGTDADFRAEILSRFKLRPWMIQVVSKLKESLVRLAILSDQTAWLDELNQQYDFFKWFDRVFNSYHLGTSKQDPAIFTEVVAQMSVSCEQTLLVDDSRENIERARLQGLQTILYKNRGQFEHELVRFCPFLKCY